jgi:hypothetical protein
VQWFILLWYSKRGETLGSIPLSGKFLSGELECPEWFLSSVLFHSLLVLDRYSKCIAHLKCNSQIYLASLAGRIPEIPMSGCWVHDMQKFYGWYAKGTEAILCMGVCIYPGSALTIMHCILKQCICNIGKGAFYDQCMAFQHISCTIPIWLHWPIACQKWEWRQTKQTMPMDVAPLWLLCCCQGDPSKKADAWYGISTLDLYLKIIASLGHGGSYFNHLCCTISHVMAVVLEYDISILYQSWVMYYQDDYLHLFLPTIMEQFSKL